MKPKKLFVSYSWSNSLHKEWVINLATELRTNYSLDVVLDVWDLKEGNDAIVFMERMVNDSSIDKVIIVSDRIYKSKANKRDGGVGTETQIISKEVYDNADQDKFVVVVSETDENGQPYLPSYYKSRIYINLSNPDTYSEEFDKLLRWIYDKPLHKKPEIGGNTPFSEENQNISLGLSVKYKTAIKALKKNEPNASAAIEDYLQQVTQKLELFRIAKPYEHIASQPAPRPHI